jgi:hypothetical protein
MIAYERAGLPPVPLPPETGIPRRASIPYLEEPWYC